MNSTIQMFFWCENIWFFFLEAFRISNEWELYWKLAEVGSPSIPTEGPSIRHWQTPVSLTNWRLTETLKHWQTKHRRKRFPVVARIISGEQSVSTDGRSVSIDGRSVTDGLPFRRRKDDWRKHWNSQKHWWNKRQLKRFSAVTRIVTKQEQDDTLHKFLCDCAASYVIWLI